jgi:hypothetical protein
MTPRSWHALAASRGGEAQAAAVVAHWDARPDPMPAPTPQMPPPVAAHRGRGMMGSGRRVF